MEANNQKLVDVDREAHRVKSHILQEFRMTSRSLLPSIAFSTWPLSRSRTCRVLLFRSCADVVDCLHPCRKNNPSCLAPTIYNTTQNHFDLELRQIFRRTGTNALRPNAQGEEADTLMLIKNIASVREAPAGDDSM